MYFYRKVEAEIISTAEQGHNFFLLGQPGTGKTYLIQKIEQRLTAGNKRVQVTASTGLAAASLKGENSACVLWNIGWPIQQ